jgi:hypothetical protein
MTALPRVQLLGREACHLCDVAREVVARVCGEYGVAWQEASVDADAALHERYSDLVPVLLVDGHEVAHWHIDETALRQALSRRG